MPDDGDSELWWVPLAALVGGARVFPDPHVHAQPAGVKSPAVLREAFGSFRTLTSTLSPWPGRRAA